MIACERRIRSTGLTAAMNAARACLLALLLCWGSAALADVAVPPLVGRVVDQTGTLSSGDIEQLQQTIRAFEASKGSQVAVLIVPTTQPETIEQYSIRVAEAWKIGRKKYDDGVLLVVAKNDRKLRIEVGYGLEGALTDVTSKRIIDEVITPGFRRGDFASGISLGVSAIMRVIEGEKLPGPPEPPRQQYSSNWLNHIDPGFAFFGIIVIAGILRTLLGRLIGAIGTGGVVGLLAWFAVGSLPASLVAAIIVFIVALVVDLSSQGSGSGSSWSGGSSSGSSGSSGSSWGDSGSSSSGGGGGSFGGGGASGSW
jgi:uncharacterized protein